MAKDGVVYSFSIARLTMDREHDALDHGKRQRFTIVCSRAELKHHGFGAESGKSQAGEDAESSCR